MIRDKAQGSLEQTGGHYNVSPHSSGAAVGCAGAAVGFWVGDIRTFAIWAMSFWVWLGNLGLHCSGTVHYSKVWTQLKRKKGALCPE